MRKVLLVLLVLMASLGFWGCDTKDIQVQGEDTIKFSPYGYEALFTHGNLHEIEIVISQEEWDAHIQDMKGYAETERFGWGMTGTYRKAKFIYKGPAGDAVIPEVGFRTKGHASRIIPQDDNGDFHRAHFKIKFDGTFDLEEGTDEYNQRNDRRFSKLRSLILRLNIEPMGAWDTSQIRELYSHDLLNKAGVYTSRTGSARLTITIDGESHYFGTYTIMEPIDKSFLTRRYGKGSNDGNLYKCLIADSGPATLEPIPDRVPLFPEQRMIGVKDWETHYRPTYDLKTNTDEADHTVLLDFIERLDALEGDKLKEYLDGNFEVDRFLRYQAMNVLLGKWDDYWTMGNNYYLYFNNDGKIEFIPSDYDMALGQGINPFYDASTGIYEWANQAVKILAMWRGFQSQDLEPLDYGAPLVEKMLEIDEYRAKYEQYFKDFITPSNKLFLYSEYEKKFNSLYELYSPYLDNDMNEGEEMINDGSVEAYFLERTISMVDELGLNEEGYETELTRLRPPGGISATDKTFASAITLTWDALPLADYYRVYRSDFPDGVYEQIGEDISGTSLQDGEVAAEATYHYRVKAFTDDGVESEFSAVAVGATSAVTSSDALTHAPTGVSATDGVYNDMIMVSWAPVPSADYYRVYRSGSADGTYNQIGEEISGTIFYDESPALNATYYYRVKAFTGDEVETELNMQAAGSTSERGSSGPEIIEGAVLVSGTYSLTNDMGTTIYTFNDDGTCAKSMPDTSGQLGLSIESEGRWSYDGTELTVDTTAPLFGELLTLSMTEVWENAFTVGDGGKLELMGLRQVTPGEDGVVMKFEGSANINAVVTGMGMDDDNVYPISVEVAVNDDGTIEATSTEVTTTYQGADVETRLGTRSETWPPDTPIRLIEFGGFYYLYPADESTLYMRQ